MPFSTSPTSGRRLSACLAAVGTILMLCSFSIAAASPVGTVIDYEQTASGALPQRSFASTAGGDGWALAFTDTNVYNIWHRVLLTVACRSKATGAVCSGNGYSGTGTKQVSDGAHRFQTAMAPPIYIDEATNRMFTMAVRGTVGSTTGTSGVVEIDLATTSANPFVAFYPLSRDGDGACYLSNCGTVATEYSTLSNATKVGTKWYVYNYVEGVANPPLPDSRNKLLCFDFATKSPCVGQPYDVSTSAGVQNGNWEPPTIAAIGNRIFINIYDSANTYSLANIACVDVSSTPTNCPGWPIAPNTHFSGSTFTAAPAFPLLNATGTPIGVCFPGNPTNACTDFAGQTTTSATALEGLATPFNVAWATTRGEAYVDGTRIYMPNVLDLAGNARVECYDFAINNLCAGFPQPKTFVLSEFEAVYTIQTDPADPRCLWVMSHGGTRPIQNFDSQTGGACVPDGFLLSISNFRENTSRCAATAWKRFTLVNPTAGNFTSGTVEFADASGSALAGIAAQNFGSNGTLDLTSLNLQTHPNFARLRVRLVGTTTSAIDVKMTWAAEWHPECVVSGQTALTANTDPVLPPGLAPLVTTPVTTTTTPTTVPPTTVPPTTPSTTSPTSPTTPPVTPAPIPAPGGDLPELGSTETLVTENGEPVTVERLVENDNALVVRSRDFELRVRGACTTGCNITNDTTGRETIHLDRSGGARVSGSGFLPGSLVHVWIVSELRYLGAVVVQPDGTYDGTFPLTDLPTGTHTLQANGTSANDLLRSANLGIVVTDEAPQVPGTVTLPATGTDNSSTVVWALLLLVTGALTIAGRGRGRTTP